VNIELKILYRRDRRSKMPATSGSYIDLQAERSATPLACCATLHLGCGLFSLVNQFNESVACSIADPDLAFSQHFQAAKALQKVVSKAPQEMPWFRRSDVTKCQKASTDMLLRSSLTVA